MMMHGLTNFQLKEKKLVTHNKGGPTKKVTLYQKDRQLYSVLGLV